MDMPDTAVVNSAVMSRALLDPLEIRGVVTN